MTGHRLLGLTGTVTVEITGACPEDCLSRMALAGIRFRGFRKTDELSIQVTIAVQDISAVRICAKKTMCNMEIHGIQGLVPRLRSMGLRILYLPVLLSLLLVVLWLQSHIWFFSVSGNKTVPTEQILWVLEENGIGFWTRTEALDTNTIKNQVLEDLPALGWITINTEGGLAQVVVRERTERPVISRDSAPANVIAKKSGVITELEVTGGTPQVKSGDIVKDGDLLISGISDLDKTMLLTRAEGEVYAYTWNRVSVAIPDTTMEKVYTGRETVRYCITIGKNTINFYKTSGISYDNYDKITESIQLALPGGYTFPVCITKITFREYETIAVPMEAEEAQRRMESALDNQLRLEMTAGNILTKKLKIIQSDDNFILSGVAECQEEIGITSVIKD